MAEPNDRLVVATVSVQRPCQRRSIAAHWQERLRHLHVPALAEVVCTGTTIAICLARMQSLALF
jgi:hypothetical protein